ncbi:MAG: hypothetical protein JSV42_18340 [Chloroflexota bacterium]|nr:MAG: hypothetical protein JSV42_18340 [Chloroflexota bacterium]
MIVEFIGSTGAGKSTLISEVERRLSDKTEVSTAYDIVASPFGLRWVTHPSVRNIIQEIISFPFFVISLPRHKKFVSLNLKLWLRRAKLNLFTFNNLRSLERKIGVYEIIRRNDQNKIILVDEGTVLTAHHVFVFTEQDFTRDDYASFSRLLPLPDVIIYIQAPVKTLLKRSLERTKPPREMRAKDPELNELYLQRAVNMFDQLIAQERIRNRVLTVENPDSNNGTIGNLADLISEFILNKKSSING